METRICSGCEYWQMDIPCGHCMHKNGYFMGTSDTMVFYDAGKDCPLNKSYIREEKLKDVEGIIADLRKSCEKRGIKGAVIGISGGKDSTIVAKLMTEVLGKENVMGVLMPNGVQKDISDSERVVKLLDISSIVVNIQDSFKGIVTEIQKKFENVDENISISESAQINIAPRIRMTVLYTVAQSLGSGWRVIGTTNKSEEYIGWLTKWGDGGVDFEPIIDFTVTELKKLGKYLGLPVDLVDKVPVDGLTEVTDEGRFGFSYEMLDKYIEQGTSGNSDIDIKIARMHEYSEHKRVPIPYFKLRV